MKKVLFVLGLVLLSAVAFSQPISYTPFTASGYSFKYVRTDSGFAVPLRDTSVGRGTTRPGSIVCRPQDSLFYGWNGARWSLVNSDLSSVIALIDEKVDSVTVDGDSIFYWKLGVSYGYVFSTASWLLTGNNITSGQFLGSLTAEPLLMKINDSTMVFVSDTLVTLGDIYSSNTGTKIDINTRDSLVNIIADNLQIIGLASSSDTTTYKPIGLSSAGVTRRMSLWPGAGWGLTGNAGTTAGTNFVGTTDNIDLQFKRNSVTAGLIGSTNTFFGLSAGNIASISGTNNTAIGVSSLAATSSGGANIGLGYFAGKYNTTASNQIFINSIDRTNLSGDQTYSILFGQQTADASVLSSQILTVNGKLGINTISPAASAVLDVTSLSKGVLVPRMTTTQRDAISSPANGLMIYNTTTLTNDVYNGTNWKSVLIPNSNGDIDMGGSNGTYFSIFNGAVKLSNDGNARYLEGWGGMNIRDKLNPTTNYIGTTSTYSIISSNGNVVLSPNSVASRGAVTFTSTISAPSSTTMTFNDLRYDGVKSAIIRTNDFTSSGSTPINLILYAGSELGTPTQGNIILAHDGTNQRGNVIVGSSTATTNAIFKITSTTKGFMPPVMTTVERNAVTWVTGDAGMIIYNTTNNKHQGWDGSAWNDLY